MTDAGRVIVNTTIGMLGFIDVSSTNVNNYTDHNKQDFGTTLARYGWRDSAYLVLPFFGPSTFRDGTGVAVDALFIDPIGYINNVSLRNKLYVGEIINTRAQLLDATNLMDDAAIDPYAFQRDSWLQMKQNQIDGKQQINYNDYLDDFLIKHKFIRGVEHEHFNYDYFIYHRIWCTRNCSRIWTHVFC